MYCWLPAGGGRWMHKAAIYIPGWGLIPCTHLILSGHELFKVVLLLFQATD